MHLQAYILCSFLWICFAFYLSTCFKICILWDAWALCNILSIYRVGVAYKFQHNILLTSLNFQILPHPVYKDVCMLYTGTQRENSSVLYFRRNAAGLCNFIIVFCIDIDTYYTLTQVAQPFCNKCWLKNNTTITKTQKNSSIYGV